jgi:hypothetical protein
MVEAAFVMPIFVLFLFGIIEFSGFLLTKEGTTNTSQAGARMASVQANDAMADQQILLRMADEAGGIPNGEITLIVIWHAQTASDTPPAGCLAGTGSNDGGAATDAIGACNVYLNPQAAGGAFEHAKSATPTTYFGCLANGGAPPLSDCNWPAVDRKIAQQNPATATGTASDATPDYVGVYVKAVHRYYTGLFGSTVTVTDQSIGKIEPQVYTTS